MWFLLATHPVENSACSVARSKVDVVLSIAIQTTWDDVDDSVWVEVFSLFSTTEYTESIENSVHEKLSHCVSFSRCLRTFKSPGKKFPLLFSEGFYKQALLLKICLLLKKPNYIFI